GRCIAETFAGLGARVFGCDLSAAELVDTAKAGVRTKAVDLADRVAAAVWVAEIERTTGGAVDVLINNAGVVAGEVGRRTQEAPGQRAGHRQCCGVLRLRPRRVCQWSGVGGGRREIRRSSG